MCTFNTKRLRIVNIDLVQSGAKVCLCFYIPSLYILTECYRISIIPNQNLLGKFVCAEILPYVIDG